MEQKKVVKD